jgi:hypothetical protein
MATYPEFKSPLTQVWQYLGRNLPYFKKVLGIVSTPVASTGFDLDCASSCNLINNYTPTIGGIQYDVYRLQGIALMLDPAATYVRLLGSLTTSSPTVNVVKNSSNVSAIDSFFGEVHTPITTFALVQDDATGVFEAATLMFINRDNNITTPDEHFFYVIGGYSVPFNAIVNVDLDVAVERGSTVVYSTL